MTIEISLCMIVKNEEKVLGRCLASVLELVDEVIIVDTGSTDHTKEICREFGIETMDFKWQDDFAKARNYSFEQATKDYILWLDADDILDKESQNKLLELKNNLSDKVDIVMMPYAILDHHTDKVSLTYWRERLIRRGEDYRWSEPVHEFIETKGIIVYADIKIIHKKLEVQDVDRNMRIYEKQLSLGKQLSERGRFYYIRELYRKKRYIEAIEVGNQYIAEGMGHKQEQVETCLVIAYCKQALGENPLPVLYQSFKYDTPRQDICCEIGHALYNKQDYNHAIFWYELALQIPIDPQAYIFRYEDYAYLIPHKGLGNCYRKLALEEM